MSNNKRGTTVETSYASSSASGGARLGLRMCRRPDNGGSAGRKTQTQANFYSIDIDFTRHFVQYAVEIECTFEKQNGTTGKFSVPRDSRDHYLTEILKGQVDPNTYVFNGDAILFSTKDILDGATEKVVS